ncbi:hypothetical protein FRB90_000502 [Tulasnella sp. 427]|nr:hypothetical protein FRB90_000502 [Tulasnella sp. 427]
MATNDDGIFDPLSTVFCANCHFRKADNPTLKLQICSGCKSTWYCGKECQRSHWKIHKQKCHLTQKGAQGMSSGELEFTEMVRDWTRGHGPLLASAGKQVLLPSKGHLEGHLLDTHYIRVDIAPSTRAPGGFEVLRTSMGKVGEILAALKEGSRTEEQGETQYRIMIESAKRNEKELERKTGDKIIGTMFIMIRGYYAPESWTSILNMYPANIPAAMAEDMKKRQRIENWDAWLKEAILKGEADL